MSLLRHHDDTDPVGPSHRAGSIEGARLYQSIKARLFDIPDEPLRVGSLRLIRRLGAGGMGEVFLAHDDQLDRPVALKLVHAKLSHETRFGERMRREARALAKLAHPNVVHVYEVGEHEGRFFLAMEYIEGQNLGEWIRESAPTWQAVIEAYLAAGEGLAAAHAAGLTHRDFKPENVLRGNDGRICVADFGLARVDLSASLTDSSDLASSFESGEAPGTLDERLSATGAVMGTPSYMPLEQLRGGQVDARSDQFAFCVALYEGLWAAPPFAGKSVSKREIALVEDRPAVPRRGAVPGWVWPIVRRGLAREPERRWPDMHSLLDALRRAPLRRRLVHRTSAALFGLSAALVGGWMGLVSTAEVGADMCVIDEAALAGVWDEPRRQATRSAFAAAFETGPEPRSLMLARETAARVEASLDAWTERWLAERASNCLATRVHGTQSQSMLDRRTLCLDRQRSEVDALVDVFVAADAGVVARAGDALRELPDLGACSAAALDAEPESTLDPAVREDIEAGYEQLARARVELRVGRPEAARELANVARSQGESLGHVPLALEARMLEAKIVIESGELEQGLDQLHGIAFAATRAGLFDLVATVRVDLARAAAGEIAKPQTERWMIDEAQLALERVARPLDPREVTLQVARARIPEQAGDYPAAIAAHERAYQLAEGRLDDTRRERLRMGIGTAHYRNGALEQAKLELEHVLAVTRSAWGSSSPEVARLEFDLGMIATDLGEFELAEQHLGAALANNEALWGPGSLKAARVRFALAYLAFAQGEPGRGCTAIVDVLAVFEAELGPKHDETASAINAAALCRFYAGDDEGALAGYRRALEIAREVLGEGHPEVALLHANIGEVLFALGRLDESLASHERALAIYAATLPDDHPDLALPLRGRALVWLATGRAAEALAALERALVLGDATPPVDRAETRFALARALVAVEGESAQARAIELGRGALVEFENAGIERSARRVRTWLAKQVTRE